MCIFRAILKVHSALVLLPYLWSDQLPMWNNRQVHVKHERIHFCRNERDVTAGVHFPAILAGICIAFYGNAAQL